MHFLMPAKFATLMLPMHALAQLATSTVSDIGILQLITPTRHANQFPADALVTLSADAYSFFTSYTEVDSFNFQSAQYLAIASAGPNAVQLAADAGPLDTLYIAQAYTSLLDNPTALLTRLHASASPWPFSSALMSQMSGILLGYESLVSRDLLNATNVPTIEPGVSISVGPGAALTGATATATSGMARTTVATQSTATLKAMGIPAATGNPQLLIAAAAAAAGVLGVIVL